MVQSRNKLMFWTCGSDLYEGMDRYCQLWTLFYSMTDEIPESLQILLNEFQEETGVNIPHYLKLLLKFCGWDNSMSVASLNENYITQMEDFAKNILPDLLDDQEKRSIYGIFSKKISSFKIVDGHRELLLKLSKIISTKNDKRKSLKRKHENSNEKEGTRKHSKNSSQNCIIVNKTQQQTSREEPNSEGDDKEEGTTTKNSRKNQRPDKSEPKTHVHILVQNYVKNFCEKELEKNLAQEIKEKIDKINIEIKDDLAEIHCIKCDKKIKAYKMTNQYGTKWVISNFNSHFKNHFQRKYSVLNELASLKPSSPSTAGSTVILPCYDKNQKQTNLLSFLTVNQSDTEPLEEPLQETTVLNSEDSFNISSNSSIINETLDETYNLLEGSEPSSEPTNVIIPGNEENVRMFFAESRTDVEASSSAQSSSILPQKKMLEKKSRDKNSKWKTEKYSRRERRLRALETYDKNQCKITDFFEIVEKLKVALTSNVEVRSAVCDSFQPRFQHLKSADSKNVDTFLKLLQDTAIQNVERSKHGKRFSEPLRLFCLYIYIISGRLTYETLYKNLNYSLPSLTTIYRSLDGEERISEGTVRILELKSFLLKRNLPLKVFISEDQTAMVQTVQYESRINQMVGFVLPIRPDNGFPETNKFEVNSLYDIEKAYNEEDISKNAYVFMAQPLHDKAPAFCLCIFGTNNKFNAEDVIKRWEYIDKEAQSHGIEVIGFSSDGDTRCLKAMKLKTNLPFMSDEESWACPFRPYFQMEFDTKQPIFIQDTVHIGTKLKTRFLKPNVLLPMGDYLVSVNHVSILMETVSKDKHMLFQSYLDSSDKMNFEAADKLSSERVLKLLKNIADSNATCQYLLLMRNILDSFLNKELDILSRIYKIWYSVFFYRIWREWVKENKHSIDKNFISLNAYTCIELNAHGLLLLIEKCRETNDESIMLPWLCSSQPCEKCFRQTRSMTSTFSTVVNFSVADLIRRLRRIQTLNEISTDLGDSFCFPKEEGIRLGKKTLNILQTKLPTIEEIMSMLDKAKNDAKEHAINLGLTNAENETFVRINIPRSKTKPEENEVSEIYLDSDNDHNDAYQRNDDNVLVDTSLDSLSDNEREEIKKDLDRFSKYDDLNFKDYSDTLEKTRNDTPFLKVTLNNEKQITVRKSTLCWFFARKKGRLSTDRIFRVQGTKISKDTSYCCTKNTTKKKTTRKAQKKAPNMKKKRNRNLRSNTQKKYASASASAPEESDLETSENDEDSDEYSIRNSSASCGYLTENEMESGTEVERPEIELKLDNYYAVYYDNTWYLGRIIKITKKKVTVKFLREDRGNYIWPKKNDIADIDSKFIFYGPLLSLVQAEGENSFALKRYESIAIQKLYRLFKQSNK